jgi:transcriptional regulator with XRE-family HTH domain
MTDKHNIAYRLKSLRQQAGFSMAKLATTIGMKGASSYQRYENSKNYHRKEYLPFDTAVRIGQALGGNGDPPVQSSDIIALSGIDRIERVVHSVASSFRSSEMISNHHSAAIASKDLHAVLADFGESSVIISQDRIYKGLDAIKEYYEGLFEKFADAEITEKKAIDTEAALVEWLAEFPDGTKVAGVDTLACLDGLIRVQTTSSYS